MNWTIIAIEAHVLTALFTVMILIPLVKNPVWWIADYVVAGLNRRFGWYLCLPPSRKSSIY